MLYFIKFALIISWVLAIISSILLFISLIFNFTYHGSPEMLLDKVRGYQRYWPVKLWFIIALITWSLIVTLS